MRNNIARRRDPLSSHLAADAITKSGVRYTQRKMILAVLPMPVAIPARSWQGCVAKIDIYLHGGSQNCGERSWHGVISKDCVELAGA
jgi:hypothetical protein